MSFSEMSTKKAAQVMMNIAVPLSNIAQDPKVASAFADLHREKLNDLPIIQAWGLAINRLFPLIADTHFADLCQVIAYMKDKTVKAVEDQTVTETLRDVRSIIDKDFLSLFTFAGAAEQGE